jgi:hypothetical protein
MHGMKNIKLEEWKFNWLCYCVTKLAIINLKDTLYDAQNTYSSYTNLIFEQAELQR